MSFVFDPAGKGLGKVLKDYQEESLRYLWDLDEGEGGVSRDVWKYVNGTLPDGKTISRASVINFLDYMVDEGVLGFTEETCKGGHRRRYRPNMDESEYKMHIAKTVIDSLMRDWPEETTKALAKLGY